VILTRFARVSKSTLVYLSKKDFTNRLATLCMKYMLSKNKIPPKITFTKKLLEGKPVELSYNFSSGIAFQMKFTEKSLEGKNPKEFFEKLISTSDRDFLKIDEERRWKIEYAPNGRSLCKKCKRQIREKEIRLGELQREKNLLVQQFYHFKCFDWSKQKGILIHGINDLSELDQQKVKKKIKPKAE